MDKISYGLRKCYYAKYDNNGNYYVPVAMPGAIRLTLTPQSEIKKIKFRQVDRPFAVVDNGFVGKLEIVSLPGKFLTDIFDYERLDNGILVERKQKELTKFALMFETLIEGIPVRCTYLNCYCNKPSFECETIADKISAKTRSLDIDIIPDLDDAGNEVIKQSISYNANAKLFNHWFETAIH